MARAQGDAVIASACRGSAALLCAAPTQGQKYRKAAMQYGQSDNTVVALAMRKATLARYRCRGMTLGSSATTPREKVAQMGALILHWCKLARLCVR